MRKNPTAAEQCLWRRLNRRQVFGLKFRRQAPIGKYIVDFVCFEEKFVVELDGGQHKKQVTYDQERTDWLESQGYRVLRFWNNDVLQNIEGVMAVIGRWVGVTDRKSVV